MTLIIGIESPEENCSYVMADSGGWMNNIREVLATPKIWRDGDWVIGGAGELTQVGTARQIKLPQSVSVGEPELTELLLSNWHYEVLAAIATRTRDIIACLGSAGESHNIPSFIAAFKGQVFAINGGAASRCTRGYDATGIVRQYALGAIRALDQSAKSRYDLGRAVMNCAYADTDYVWGPVNWMSTTGDKGGFDASTAAMTEQLFRGPF